MALIQEKPMTVLFGTLGIILLFMTIYKADGSLFFQLGFLSNTIYNLFVVLVAILGVFAVFEGFEWSEITPKTRNITIGLALVLTFIFIFMGEMVGEFVLAVIGG